MLEMTSGNVADLGFGVLMLIGLLLVIGGVIMLARSRGSGEPGTKVTVFNVEVDNAGPGTLIMLAGVALAAVGGFFLSRTLPQQATTVASGTIASPTLSTTASPASQAAFPFARITYPRPGTKVSRHKGFVEGGTSAALGPDTIWVLDHPSHGVYYIDGPATINGSNWSFNDYPLGNASDPLPYSLTVITVEARPSCAASLDNDAKTLTIPKIGSLPDGCHKFAGVTVNVTRP